MQSTGHWSLWSLLRPTILRGAKPGDVPIQNPDRFEMIVNLKTAQAIGLSLPEGFLLRADKVADLHVRANELSPVQFQGDSRLQTAATIDLSGTSRK